MVIHASLDFHFQRLQCYAQPQLNSLFFSLVNLPFIIGVSVVAVGMDKNDYHIFSVPTIINIAYDLIALHIF